MTPDSRKRSNHSKECRTELSAPNQTKPPSASAATSARPYPETTATTGA